MDFVWLRGLVGFTGIFVVCSVQGNTPRAAATAQLRALYNCAAELREYDSVNSDFEARSDQPPGETRTSGQRRAQEGFFFVGRDGGANGPYGIWEVSRSLEDPNDVKVCFHNSGQSQVTTTNCDAQILSQLRHGCNSGAPNLPRGRQQRSATEQPAFCMNEPPVLSAKPLECPLSVYEECGSTRQKELRFIPRASDGTERVMVLLPPRTGEGEREPRVSTTRRDSEAVRLFSYRIRDFLGVMFSSRNMDRLRASGQGNPMTSFRQPLEQVERCISLTKDFETEEMRVLRSELEIARNRLENLRAGRDMDVNPTGELTGRALRVRQNQDRNSRSRQQPSLPSQQAPATR